MFKIGDIVKFTSDRFLRTQWTGQSTKQSYVIVGHGVIDGMYRLEGLSDRSEQLMCVEHSIELDIVYARKLKLKKICSKLET